MMPLCCCATRRAVFAKPLCLSDLKNKPTARDMSRKGKAATCRRTPKNASFSTRGQEYFISLGRFFYLQSHSLFFLFFKNVLTWLANTGSMRLVLVVFRFPHFFAKACLRHAR
jgi:hypothetical protein